MNPGGPIWQHGYLVVRTCAEFGVAVVPRGAGTGLSGGADATDGPNRGLRHSPAVTMPAG